MVELLITGSNGFLGSALVRAAAEEALPFWATDIHPSCVLPDVKYYQSNILDPPAAGCLPRGLTTVIHAAGLAHVFDKVEADKAPFHEVNVTGTVNMMNAAAAAGAKHFILISSVSVYGPFTQGVCGEDDPCLPEGPYARSKFEAEEAARAIALRSGMALTILRLATLYGEGDPGNVGRLIESVDSGHFIWIGRGNNNKSLVHRDDAARACIIAARRSKEEGISIYNVSALPCTMREVVDAIADSLGRARPSFAIPASLAVFFSRCLSVLPMPRLRSIQYTVKKWLAEDVYRAERFRDVYDFRPLISLTEGIQREVDWYLGNKRKD